MNWEQIIQVSISNINVSVTYDSSFRQYAIWLHSNTGFRLLMKVEDVRDLSQALQEAISVKTSTIAFQTDRFYDKVYIDTVANGLRFVQFKNGYPLSFISSKDDIELLIAVFNEIALFMDMFIIRIGSERFGLIATYVLAYTLRLLIVGQFANESISMLADQIVDNNGPFMAIYDLLEEMLLRNTGNSGDGDAGGIFLNKRMAIDLVTQGISSSVISPLIAHSLIAKHLI